VTAFSFGRALGLTASLAALALVAGCSLSEELDRERNPERAAAPTTREPAPTTDSAAPLYGEIGPLTSPPPTPATSCPASGVRITPDAVSAAMGLRAMGVTLTNCGTKTYRLNGYPQLRVLDEHREPLDVQILEGTEPVTTAQPDPGPHPVTLKPNESALTVLVWRNTVTDTTTTAVSGTYLGITPAKGTPATTITPQGRIDLGNTGRIGTTAWAKTPSGS